MLTTDRSGLTERQRELLVWIGEYIATHQYSPSYRDIQHGLQLASHSNVTRYIRRLCALGYLLFDEGVAKSIRLSDLGREEFNRKIGTDVP